MKKIVTIVLFVLVAYSFIQAQLYYPEGINMPGAYNGYVNPPSNANFLSKPEYGGNIDTINVGTLRWHTSFSVAASGADAVAGTYAFLFTSGPTTNLYNNKWAGTTVTMNAVQSYSFNIGADNSITLTNGKYYTVNFQDNGYASTSAMFMETTGAPATITNVTDNNAGAGTDVTVTITTSGTPASEQNIFVRYTTNNWISWSIVQASGSGTSWTATIPASGNTGPTSSNRYYVFTSTLSLATESGFLSGVNIDLSTINLFNNNGVNLPLPVELTSFSALIKNKSVNLVWHTATEVNNYGFEIQRSGANRSFAKVGFVNGNGNSNSANDYSFTDKTANTGKYIYRLKQIDNNGQYEYSKEVEVDLGKPTTFALNQNYPNPFNPSTSIQYSVVGNQYVSLKVFNVLGKEVASLVNEKQEPGTYTVDFSAANLSGGAYFYRLQAGEFVQTKKMILLK